MTLCFFHFVNWEFHYQLSTRTLWCFNWSSRRVHLKFRGSLRRLLHHLVALRRTTRLISLGSDSSGRWRSEGQKSILGSTMNNWRAKRCHSTAFSVPLAPAMLTFSTQTLPSLKKAWENPLREGPIAFIKLFSSAWCAVNTPEKTENIQVEGWNALISCEDFFRLPQPDFPSLSASLSGKLRVSLAKF